MRLYTLLMLLTCGLSAQSIPQFDKPAMLCEDRWVAMLLDSAKGEYTYGFIYLDQQAGFTADIHGAFKIDASGSYVNVPGIFDSVKGSVKIRLKPKGGAYAILPSDKIVQLGLPVEPDWLKIYKGDTLSSKGLYDWGFQYNAYGLCKKGARYLEKAHKIEPKYKGLEVELAFSYNCLGRYDLAAVLLESAYEDNPTDAYVNKELIYAQLKAGDLLRAAESCKRALIVCTDTMYNAENTYNILYEFFEKRDIANFDAWKAPTKRWNAAKPEQLKGIGIMEVDLKK